ncbi:ATP-binding protein [Desulfoscipio sp. XC116]|uniref:ATP-binding protein n=1 Tax=Desulfoscipio sp. XC116 TaxID=3144975 RepID=UPI00325AC05A
MMKDLNNELVRYSRAGDAFHYRWAARRCLKMVYPSSPVKYIIIEGSKERKLAGEYIIDVSEYFGKDENKETHYFQLKHTTVRKEKPFTLSGLKDTSTGFAERYKEHLKGKTNRYIQFYLVTNRPIAEKLKKNMKSLQNRQPCEKSFLNTMEQYTKLKGKRLVDFCKCFIFMDGMGDYNEQLLDLQVEISQLLAGTADHPQIDTITSLVGEKALPNSDGVIYPEDILKRFGCTSVGDMYPAPTEFETNDDIIWTKQQQELIELILKSQEAIIIHAAGGVGKSVFAREIPRFLTDDSIAVIYDSFGAGKYRNRSQPRHRYRDGLIQIVNELAGIGLCDPLIAQSAALEDEILRKFLYRLQTAIDNLKKVNQNAQIAIVIDAADNAEMAGKEFVQACFVHELLREKLPDDCHLVMLCRTERIELLQPDSSVKTSSLLLWINLRMLPPRK